MVVRSLDVVSLSPSIDTSTAGEICRDRVKKSSVKFEGIDSKQAVIYLKVAMSPVEKVDAKIQG